MKLSKQEKLLIVAAILVLLAIGGYYYGKKNREEMQEEIDELYRLIRKKVNAMGTDFKSILDKVTSDTRNMKKLQDAAKSIYNAFFWKDLFGFEHRAINDDEDAVRDALKKLTKSEAKALLSVFAKETGHELDEFLKEYNDQESLNKFYITVQNLT